MHIATVDLDDTLINTQMYYVDATDSYVEYMNEKFGFENNSVEQLIKEIDDTLVDSLGLSEERFPTSFARTTETLLQDNNDVDMEYEK